METSTIALMGNPNVGKSTVFNALTGMRQHTGNWPGKTVGFAEGFFEAQGRVFRLIDLPGTYSLSPRSAEEAVAEAFISSGEADAVCVVCDATCLERNLILALQVIAVFPKTLVCVNLLDEAGRRGAEIDLSALGASLGADVVGVSARRRKDLAALLPALASIREADEDKRELFASASPAELVSLAEGIAAGAVRASPRRSERLDKILTGRFTALPVMLLLLSLVFWLTISGANYPSALLSELFSRIEGLLVSVFARLGAPWWLTGALIYGIFRTLCWIVAVMLPPMAIFFPLFTLLEDFGYLPRIAFNLDRCFKCSGACGKQSLTMMMGFGCNAAGVTGCRIIDSPRERLIAILTNSLVPCNGRFPTMTALIALFFAGGSGAAAAAVLAGIVVLGVAATLFSSRLLSKTLLKGVPSSFTLELPPYRPPQIGKILVRSVFDRTLFVLGRAVSVAAPAGLLIWLAANISISGKPLLCIAADLLTPFAGAFGLDGAILLAFILSLPANEIMLPIAVMVYTASGLIAPVPELAALAPLLRASGWSWLTALNTVLFSLMHWPCGTTLLTIKKETGSVKWTLVSALLPTLLGLSLCFLTNLIFG